MFWKCGERSGLAAAKADFPASRINTMLAHTRAGSKGSPRQDANNHPVVAPGMVLTHNGILSNDEEIYKMLGVEPTEGIVDSLAAAYLLSYGPECGLGTDVPALLSLVEGDAALAWLDADQDDVLNLARLRGRPLVHTKTVKGDFVYGSTEAAVRVAGKACGIDFPNKFHVVDEGTFLQVRRGKIIHRSPIKLAPERTWDYEQWYMNEGAAQGYRHYGRTGHIGGDVIDIRERIEEAITIEQARQLLPAKPDLHQLFPTSKPQTRWSTAAQRWVEC